MQSHSEHFNLDKLIQHNRSAARAEIRNIDLKAHQLQSAIYKSITDYNSLYHKPDGTQEAFIDTSFTILTSAAVRTFTFAPLPIKLFLVMASYYTSRKIYII